MFISVLPKLSIADDFMVMIQGDPVPIETVAVSKSDPRVLEIDVTAAWAARTEAKKATAGWSNDVDLNIYFRV